MTEGFNASQRELEIYELRQRLEKAEWVLQSSGFRRCDIAACNCGSWHQVGGYAERFREIKEAVEEAGYSTNGKILLDVINEILTPASSVSRLCQKCGTATKGEEAWVDGQIWCHPCADEASAVSRPLHSTQEK